MASRQSGFPLLATVCNAAGTLEGCLESVRDQSYPCHHQRNRLGLTLAISESDRGSYIVLNKGLAPGKGRCDRNGRGREVCWRGLLFRDPVARRIYLKALAYRLPGRPAIAFLYHCFIRLGVLDGFAGLTFCVLRAIYETTIDLKPPEVRRCSRGLAV
jgi:hypothetical protein